MELLAIDHVGLEKTDREILRVLIEQFKGGPAGVAALAAATGEDRSTIEEVYEPYLLQLGLLARTPQGRVATDKAWEHLGLEPPEKPAQNETLL